MEGAEERARLRLLVGLAAATWFTAPELFGIVASRAVALTARQGVAQDSPFAFAARHRPRDGLRVRGGPPLRPPRGRARRTRPILPRRAGRSWCSVDTSAPGARRSGTAPLLRRAYTRGIESGELEYAAYALANLVFALWFRGAPLDTVLTETDAALAFYRRIGHLGDTPTSRPFMRAARCLKGLTRDCGRFDDGEFEEAGFLRETAENGLAQAVYHVLRVQACYLLDEPARSRSRTRGRESAGSRTSGRSSRRTTSSIRRSRSRRCTTARRRRSRTRSSRSCAGTTAGSSSGPDSRPPRSGTSRTWSRRRSRASSGVPTIELYERAIAGARREGCGHEEALAHERCARCLEARGDHEAAEAHFRTAVEGYAAWGALAKVRLIAEQRPSTVEVARSSADATGGARAIKAIDLGFLLRASETLTSELVLDRLLQKLMPICIEAAAAERAVLVLEEKGPVVRAVASADGEAAVQRTPLESASAPSSVIEQVLRTDAEVDRRRAA